MAHHIAVVGATSWGLTLAALLARAGNEVVVLTRDGPETNRLSATRALTRLPELVLPQTVTFESAPGTGKFDGAVVAVPAQSLRETLASSGLSRSTAVLSAAKGIEHATGKRMSEVFAELGWSPDHVSAISGPNLAHEIARGLPATAVVASSSPAQAEAWQRALSSLAFRVYTSDDIVGVEIGGSYKNVIAIAAGAAWGMDFGANTVSAIMTRGLAEMSRLGVALGADPLTFQGLSGVGDLATTCFSPLSRNRRFGELLAQGKAIEEARTTIGEAIEGIATATVALQLATSVKVELPICTQVAAVVSGEKTIAAAMTSLLSRPLRDEAGSRA